MTFRDFPDWPWDADTGQELCPLPADPYPWGRVVVCLSVWNDVNELVEHWGSWAPHVDYILALDGPFGDVSSDRKSDDGTADFLLSKPNVHYHCGTWPDQAAKRSTFFQWGQSGDLFWIVDADEEVTDGHRIRETPYLDVGWLTYRSPLYTRAQHQPRVFRWQPGLRYDGRHHWVWRNDDLVASHQRGGDGFDHRILPVRFYNDRGVHRTAARRRVVQVQRAAQTDVELEIGPRVTGHEPLRICQLGPFDPGHVMGRLHSAINTTSPHESAMACGFLTPYLKSPRQYPFELAEMPDLASTADIIHHHVSYVGEKYLRVDLSDKTTVIHHHGTEYRRDPVTATARDAEKADLRLASNLELLQYGDDLTYLPNPVPVCRLIALESRWAQPFAWDSDKTASVAFRVAHSPTKREIKGTEAFLRACSQVPGVEWVLIEGVSLRESLEIKATCHAVFDSFWLGMQVSGLEGAAMGLPVIAGDPDVRAAYEAWLGYCPFTYANDETALVAALERLAHDPEYWAAEAARVANHVRTYHDYAAVAATYLDLLDARFNWRARLGLSADLRLPLRRERVPV